VRRNTTADARQSAQRIGRVAQAAALLAALLGPGQAPARAAEEASRVRILLVCDMGGDDEERERRGVNRAAVERALETALRKQGLGRRYTLDILAGPGATRQAVLDYYRGLRTGPSEALLFYSNAHGRTDPQRGHYLDLGGRRLYRSELRRAMAAQGPRLAVILTDSCAILPGKEAPNAKAAPAKGQQTAPPAPKAGDGSALRDLLFQHEGLVDINAARRGENCWGHIRRGNCFTRALVELLGQPVSRFDRDGDGFVEWGEFYRALTLATRQEASRLGTSQSPQAFALGRRSSRPGPQAAGSRAAGGPARE
jgi:hypothetical protein